MNLLAKALSTSETLSTAKTQDLLENELDQVLRAIEQRAFPFGCSKGDELKENETAESIFEKANSFMSQGLWSRRQKYYEAALYLYIEAARAGNGNAVNNLGEALWQGRN